MKYSQIVFLPIFFTLSTLCAQNWSPVLPGETQHYRLAGAGRLTHSIRIDSARIAGIDSVFYLNRVLERLAVASGGDTLYAPLRDQGQFLGQTMTQKPDGSLVFHAENLLFDTTITLWPQAGAGFSWLAVQQGPVMATIASVSTGLVLGEPDSLKTIQFDNGAEWILSKRHGLVRCSDFIHHAPVELSGLEARQLGDRLYRFEDFFDFEAGDVFQYETYYFALSGPTTTSTKRRILQKIILPDTTRYVAERRWKQVRVGWMAGTTSGVDTTWWDFTRADFPNVSNYPGQLLPVAGNFFYPDNRFSATAFLADGLQLGTTFHNDPEYADPAFCSVLKPATDDPFISVFPEGLECAPEQYHEIYRLGLGRTSYWISYLDNFLWEELRGAVTQGDTTGVIDPDWVFTAERTPPFQPAALRAYPNPVTDRLHVHTETPLRGLVRITLSDALGRTVRQFETRALAGDFDLDIAGLPAGAYFLYVGWDDGQWSDKVWVAP